MCPRKIIAREIAGAHSENQRVNMGVMKSTAAFARQIASGCLSLLFASTMSLSLATIVSAAMPQFTSPLDNEPLEVKTLPGEQITEAVHKFYDTGEDPYKGDAAALAKGRDLYQTYCQACHLPDGSGRIGPSLIGDTHHYPRFTTDKGMFEIIYGGATGAMQPFGKRLTQDQILLVMAYVRTLKK
jgi:cytochrome c-L